MQTFNMHIMYDISISWKAIDQMGQMVCLDFFLVDGIFRPI